MSRRYAAGSEDRGGAMRKAGGPWPLEATKGKQKDSSLEVPEKRSSADTLILVQ